MKPQRYRAGILDYARDDGRMVVAETVPTVAMTEVALHVSNSCALPWSRSFFFSPDAAPLFLKLFGSG